MPEDIFLKIFSFGKACAILKPTAAAVIAVPVSWGASESHCLVPVAVLDDHPLNSFALTAQLC